MSIFNRMRKFYTAGIIVGVAAVVGMALMADKVEAKSKAVDLEFEVDLDVEVGEPVMIAGKDGKAYIKIGLTGFKLPSKAARTPINLSLVLDRSSSMSGEKFEKAKEAAIMVVNRLDKNDIVSIISYDSTVDVLVPATKAHERDYIRQRISALSPRGSTALFAGVSRGIEEVRKFLDKERVNRVILLSDGQANIGPSSPNELGRLGAAAGEMGISVTTIGLGLGYNEDLMTQLAMHSDGNHAFAQTARDLVAIFNHELGDVLSVVAQDVQVEIIFSDGVRPLRSFHRAAEIHGKKVHLSLNQLYAEQEKFFLLEAAVPATKAGISKDFAKVAVSYDNMHTKKRAKLRDNVKVAFSGSAKEVAKKQQRVVMVAAVEAVATDKNRTALALRDQGKIAEAEKVLKGNAAYLKKESKRLKSKKLKKYGLDNESDAANLAPEQWNKQRKSMREGQYKNASQRSW